MPTALARAFGQLSDPRVRRTLWLSIGITLALLALTIAAIGYALGRVDFTSIPLLETVIDVLGGLGIVVAALLLFPALTGIVTSFFLEDVAEAVERRHYPDIPPARSQSVFRSLATALRFFVVLVAFNLLALVVVYFIPLLNLIVFYSVNGYLLGREYFELVAARRLAPDVMSRLRRRHSLRLFLAGIVIAALLSIPFINLVVPIIATAYMVHIFQRLVANSSGSE